MDPPPAAVDEETEKQLREENQRLETENEVLLQRNIVRATIVLNGFMELLIEELGRRPNLSQLEAFLTLKDAYNTFRAKTILRALSKEERKGADEYLDLFFRFCWEYIQLFHPERRRVFTIYAVFRDDNFDFFPECDITPKEYELYVKPYFDQIKP